MAAVAALFALTFWSRKPPVGFLSALSLLPGEKEERKEKEKGEEKKDPAHNRPHAGAGLLPAGF